MLNDTQRAVRDVLTRLFWRDTERNVLLDDAGIPPYLIDLSGSAVSAWHQIVVFAVNSNKMTDLAAAAVSRFPENEILDAFVANQSIPISDHSFSPPREIAAEFLERITGPESTLLSISFLEQGILAARCVVKIKCPQWVGSGFLLKNNWLLTNNHVIPNDDIARRAIAMFGYNHEDSESVQVGLDFNTLKMSAYETGDDWSLIKLLQPMNDEFGHLEFAKEAPQIGSFVNIIQHPSGRPKKIALYHNTIYKNITNKLGQKRIQYLTDTEPGSSGSPVFDSNWRVVALHHASSSPLDQKTRLPISVNQGIPASVLREVLPLDALD